MDGFAFLYSCAVEIQIYCTNLTDKLLKTSVFYIAVLMAGNVQNKKPVQNCTGFLFCTFLGMYTL